MLRKSRIFLYKLELKL